jgi:hypothetical protein
MAKKEKSPPGGDDQAEDVKTASADAADAPSDAAVNPAVAFTLLGERPDGESEEPGGRERHGDRDPPAS